MVKSSHPTMSQVRQLVDSKLAQNLEYMHNVVSSSGSINTAGTMFPLTQSIVQGDATFERSGEVVTVVNVDFNIMVFPNSAATGRSLYLRAILFQDTMNNGNTPSTADLITTTDITATYADEVWKTKRIRILADVVLPTGAVNSALARPLFKHKIKVNKKVFYQGTTDATASNGPNSLWLYIWSSDGSSLPSVQANTLVRFRDA